MKNKSTKLWLVVVQVIDALLFVPGMMIAYTLGGVISTLTFPSVTANTLQGAFLLGYPIGVVVLMLYSWKLYREQRFGKAILLSFIPIIFSIATPVLFMILWFLAGS